MTGKDKTLTQSLVTRSARETLTETAILKKIQRNLSWQQLAEGTGLSVTFVTAAVLGQHALPSQAAKIVGSRLDLDDDAIALLQAIPLRGSLDAGIPTD